MFIPTSQKEYNAELPKKFGSTDIVWTAQNDNGEYILDKSGSVPEPTIYGGKALPVFASPQNKYDPDSLYKSVAFAEGNNISFMSGLPVIQLFAGFPTRTQLRFRFFTLSVMNSSLLYYTVGLNQNIDKMFGIFEVGSPYAIGLNAAYHSISRSPGIDISSLAIGTVFSEKNESGFGYYFGLQYEDLNGTVDAVRKIDNTQDKVNSPYEEVRNGEDLNLTISTFTNFKVLGGLSYRTGFIELHVDAAYASQPMIAGGVSFWFFDTGEEMNVFEPIFVPERTMDEIPAMAHLQDVPFKTIGASDLDKPHVPIRSDFQMYNENGTELLQKITIETFRSRQLRAFLPFVFFDENAADIPLRYIRYNQDEVKNFSIKELMGRSSLDTYYYLLNILGKRLQEYPNASITLTGCNSNIKKEKNNKILSQQRADNVKAYLVDTWKIDPNRIKTIARNLPEKFSNIKDPDGIVENRRVEITSETWEVVAPIVIEDTLRFIKPDGILVKNEAFAESPIKRWEFNVTSNDSRIANFSGDGNPDKSLKIDLAKNDLLKSKLGNDISAYLKVETKEEEGLSQIQKVPVEIIHKDSSINVYNLILFDFNKAELNKPNLRIADFINNDLQEDADVKVLGHTDRIGKDDYNRKLSDGRAKSTSSHIKAKNIEAIGVGEADLLYDNTTPEGRFYCRTVQVQVRQKNKSN
jgi:outer membrane protein OmpA-like peptidoglycan-associated protein